MTIHMARLIRELKKRCTYRRLAEIYYLEKDNAHGNQLYGQELCKEALKVLYPRKDYWCKDSLSKKLREENLSYLGNFYWWE